MATIEYSVAGQQIVVTKDEKLVENTIGIYTVGFTFDAASWGDFTQKTAVFVHEDYPDTPPYEVPIDDGEAPIPAAVLKYGNIMIGVYGSTQTQQYPTIWAPAKRVWPGAGPGVEPPEDPVFGMVVRTAPQELTEEQQEIARTNIGAAPKVVPDSTPGNITIIGSNNNIVDGGHKFSDAFPVGSASGSIVTIEDGADGIPIKSMTVQIEPVQAGSGDPSPSNVRTITGWTKATINRTALNLLKPMLTEAKTVRGVTFTPHEDGSITGSGTSTNSINGSYIKFGVVNLKGGYDYWAGIFVQPTGTTGDFPNLQLANDVTNSAIYRIKNGGYNYSIDADRTVRLNPMGSSSTNFDNTVFYPMFSIKSQGTEFEPYKGNVYEIEFPDEAGTVYGGELTVNEDGTGTLTVDRKGVTLNGSEEWTMYASGKFFVPCTSGATDAVDTRSYYISNKYLFAGTGDSKSSVVTVDQRFYGQLSHGRIWVYDSSFTTLDAWETELATTPLTCVYPLATPVVYQLTAEQVQTLLFSTLKGMNNVWADTGDISLEYNADPTLFVEQKTTVIKKSIAFLQDDFTAVQPYVVNDLVYVGDTLYIVTSAIAQGATMTPDTNCSQTTLNAVIKSLR